MVLKVSVSRTVRKCYLSIFFQRTFLFFLIEQIIHSLILWAYLCSVVITEKSGSVAPSVDVIGREKVKCGTIWPWQ